MAEATEAVEQPNSCKIAVNAKGLWSGEVKVYAESIDAACVLAALKAEWLSKKIKEVNGQ